MKFPPSWTRFLPAVACAALGGVGLATGRNWLAWVGFTAAVVAAGAAVFSILFAERGRAKVEEGEVVAQATFLDSLVGSMGTIAQTREGAHVLEQPGPAGERAFRWPAR